MTYAQGGLISSPDGADNVRVRIKIGERVINAADQILELQLMPDKPGWAHWVRVSTDEEERAWQERMSRTLERLNDGGSA